MAAAAESSPRTAENTPEEQKELDSTKAKWNEGMEQSIVDEYSKQEEKEALAKSFVEEATEQKVEGGISISFKDLTFEVHLLGKKPGSNCPCAGDCEPGVGKCKNCCCAEKCPTGCCGNHACECLCEHRPSKTILKGIENVIPAGSMVALMGASGAGKTTLLNVLARRNRANTGEVLYNGKSPTDDDIAKLVAYIQQEEIFFGSLTVKEHLLVQARLRLPRHFTSQMIADRVDMVINRMQLTKCQNAKIGNTQMGEGRGISGGEKKRLNIASELITAPSVVFADEPTTGLDSFIAYTAISVLRQLADRGHTVICTIHQPNTKIFELFDTLLLMGEGHILYAGDRLGGVVWFEELGYKCSISTNPADFLIKTVAVTDTNREAKLIQIDEWAARWKEKGQEFLERWKHGGRDAFLEKIHAFDQKRIAAVTKPGDDGTTMPRKEVASSFMRSQSVASRASFRPADTPLEAKGGGTVVEKAGAGGTGTLSVKGQKISWCQQFNVLLKRGFISMARDPVLMGIRALQSLILAILQGFLFFRLNWSAYDSQTKLATCFNMLVNQALASSMGVVQTFPEEMPIVRREYDSGILNVFAYFNAKNIAELPIMIGFPIFYALIIHYLTGLHDNFVRYLIVMVLVVLNANAAVSIGYFASCVTNSTEVASGVSSVLLLPLILLGGFIVNPAAVAYFWVVIQHISPFWYGFSACTATIFKRMTLDFSRVAYDSLGNMVQVPATGEYFLVERAYWPYWEHDLSVNGETVIRKKFYIWCFFALLIMIIFCRGVSALGLYLLFRYSKKEGS